MRHLHQFPLGARQIIVLGYEPLELVAHEGIHGRALLGGAAACFRKQVVVDGERDVFHGGLRVPQDMCDREGIQVAFTAGSSVGLIRRADSAHGAKEPLKAREAAR